MAAPMAPQVGVGDDVVEPVGGQAPAEPIKQAADVVCLRAEMLHERLTLEVNVRSTCCRLVHWSLCMLAIMCMLSALQPPEHIWLAHSRIEREFSLSAARLGGVKSADAVYAFAEDFGRRSDGLQALGRGPWCEARHFQQQWDSTLGASRRVCVAPPGFGEPGFGLRQPQAGHRRLHSVEDLSTMVTGASAETAAVAARRLAGGSAPNNDTTSPTSSASVSDASASEELSSRRLQATPSPTFAPTVATPSPTFAPTVATIYVVLIVENVDYNLLAATPGILANFESAAKQAFVDVTQQCCGSSAANFALTLTPGSVVIQAFFQPPGGVAVIEVAQAALQTQTLSTAVVTGISGVPNITQVSTGAITVSAPIVTNTMSTNLGACDPMGGYRYYRFSNGGPVANGVCESAWNLYDVSFYMGNGMKLPVSADSSSASHPDHVGGLALDLWDDTYFSGDQTSAAKLGGACWNNYKVGLQWLIVDLGSSGHKVNKIELTQNAGTDSVASVRYECSHNKFDWTMAETKPVVGGTNTLFLYVPASTTTTTTVLYSYIRLSPYKHRQVTFLPSMVYQTRFQGIECGEGFKQQYELQGTNPAHFHAPAVDGTRQGARDVASAYWSNSTSTLVCVNRDERKTWGYAVNFECPPDEKATNPDCNKDSENNGTFVMTKATEIRGEAVYPELLLDAAPDMKRLRQVQWLDAGTDAVTVATLVYTEGLEVFTLVSVEFAFDTVGNVGAQQVKMDSWKTLGGKERMELVLAGVAGLLLSFAAFLVTLFEQSFKAKSRPEEKFEVCTRGLLLFIPFMVMVWWSTCKPLADTYEESLNLLNTSTEAAFAGPLPDSKREEVLTNVISSAEALIGRTGALDIIITLCYMCLHFQFVQLLAYFHVHPRTSLVSATLLFLCERFVYVFLILGMVFVFSAALAHWMFGFALTAFGTYGDSLITQLHMLYGDYVAVPGAQTLDEGDGVMYWMHAVLFASVVFFFLRFFFLAAVVDSFVAARAMQKSRVALSAFQDLVDVFVTFRFLRKRQFFNQRYFLTWLENWISKRRKAGLPLLLAPEHLEKPYRDIAQNFYKPSLDPEARELMKEERKMQAQRKFQEQRLGEALVRFYGKKLPGLLCVASPGMSSPGAGVGMGEEADIALAKLPVEADHTSLRAAADAASPQEGAADPRRFAGKVVHEVFSRLAEAPLHKVHPYVMIGRLSIMLNRELGRRC